MALLEGVKLTNKGPKVDIGKVFGQEVTFATLGAAFHVNAYDVLTELCKASGTNAEAFDKLYQAFLRDHPWAVAYTSVEERRFQYWDHAHGKTDNPAKQTLPFLDWKIPKYVVIRLPLSASDAVLVRADATTASRYVKLAIDCPEFAKLELMTERLRELSGELEKWVAELEQQVKPLGQQSLPYLMSAERLLTMMCEAIPNTAEATIKHHANDHADLLGDLRAVLERGSYSLIQNPFMYNTKLQKRLDAAARGLLDELEDSTNAAYVNKLLKFYDAAEQRDAWARFEKALCEAIVSLSRSNHADEFVTDHILPFLAAYADGADVSALLARVKTNSLKHAILEQWKGLVPSSPRSVLVLMGNIGKVSGGMIGNSKGPASVAVAAVMSSTLCARYLAMRSVALDNSGVPGAALCLRVLMRVAHLSDAGDIDSILAAVFPEAGGTPDLGKLKAENWTTKFMSHWGWASAYALANLAAFISLFSQDADLTLRRIVELVGSGTQLAVPVAELAQRVFATSHAHWAAKIENSLPTLAAAAGLLAVALALWTLHDKKTKWKTEGLDFEDTLEVVGALATAISGGGWLLWTVMGKGWALGVMMTGTLLGAAVLIVTIAYQTANAIPGTAIYIHACIDTFKTTELGQSLIADDSKFRKALSTLEQTLGRVERNLISLSGQQDKLFTLARYFSPSGCATILELDPHFVDELLA